MELPFAPVLFFVARPCIFDIAVPSTTTFQPKPERCTDLSYHILLERKKERLSFPLAVETSRSPWSFRRPAVPFFRSSRREIALSKNRKNMFLLL